MTRRLRRLIEHQIRPLVLERGGDLVFRGWENGIVELTFSGSPGAALAISDNIRETIVHYVPEVLDIRIVASDPDSMPTRSSALHGSLLDRVNQVLDEQINPAVRTHGGLIRLVSIEGDTACVRLEGGCQGCAMADVTLRQGVEVAIKDRVPGIVAVVDITDHAAGKNPFFKTRKGPS